MRGAQQSGLHRMLSYFLANKANNRGKTCFYYTDGQKNSGFGGWVAQRGLRSQQGGKEENNHWRGATD